MRTASSLVPLDEQPKRRSTGASRREAAPRAGRVGGRVAREVLEEDALELGPHVVELDAESDARVARPAPVEDARDGADRVEPAVVAPSAKRSSS